MAKNDRLTVVELATASDNPHASSSSDSLDSSRPNSKGSSTISRSASLSPKDISAIEGDGNPTLSSDSSLLENTSESQSQRQNDPPISVQPDPVADPSTTHGGCRGSWISNTLSAMTLGVTLIGMLVFGKLAIWTAWNDLYATCLQQSETPIRTKNCQKILSTKDVDFPPYRVLKRVWNATLEAGSSMKMDNITKRSNPPAGGLGSDAVNSSVSNFSFITILFTSIIVIGLLALILFRRWYRYWRAEETFTSPVKSDWQFTRHHDKGPETVGGEGYRMIRRNPEDGHPLGQLRRHIRSSQPDAVHNPTGEPTSHSRNTSENTRVGPWKDTRWGALKVSVTSDESNEKHENLIELKTEGPNNTFFDPETGEFIHLTPWKSTGVEEFHGLKPDGKGSIKRAFAQMTLGASGWAGGIAIDDQLAEELQANSTGLDMEEHDAGDCITGNTLNQRPSGKHIVA